jgi:hypothetical protein
MTVEMNGMVCWNANLLDDQVYPLAFVWYCDDIARLRVIIVILRNLLEDLIVISIKSQLFMITYRVLPINKVRSTIDSPNTVIGVTEGCHTGKFSLKQVSGTDVLWQVRNNARLVHARVRVFPWVGSWRLLGVSVVENAANMPSVIV